MRTYDFLVKLVTLSGSGALQLLPGVLGVCMPSKRLTTRTGVLSGMVVGLVTLYIMLFVNPNRLGVHHGVWALGANFLTTYAVSRFTAPPSFDTVERIHGEIESFVYADRS